MKVEGKQSEQCSGTQPTFLGSFPLRQICRSKLAREAESFTGTPRRPGLGADPQALMRHPHLQRVWVKGMRSLCVCVCVLVSYRCRNKVPQSGWLRQQKCILVSAPEARRPRSRCGQGWVLLRAERAEALPGFSFWLVNDLLHVRMHVSYMSPSIAVCVQISPSHVDTSRIGLGPSHMTSS